MTLSMDMIGGIYGARANIYSGELYHSLAPSVTDIPFVTMEVLSASPDYISNQTSYEVVRVLFTCVGVSDSEVETMFGEVMNTANVASPINSSVKLRVAVRDRKINRDIIKSRNNQMVWVGELLIDFWIT